MTKAVFLDRDGVINSNIFNSSTGEWEAPQKPEDFKLFPWTLASLKRLQKYNFHLFLVSNQPDYAKGKISLDDIKNIHEKLHYILISEGVDFSEYFYCYHHPEGIVAEYSGNCECRKPGTFFLKEAERKYSLNLKNCWMIGDRHSDILCGQKAGIRTVMILNSQQPQSEEYQKSNPDFKAENLAEAVEVITKYGSDRF